MQFNHSKGTLDDKNVNAALVTPYSVNHISYPDCKPWFPRHRVVYILAVVQCFLV